MLRAAGASGVSAGASGASAAGAAAASETPEHKTGTPQQNSGTPNPTSGDHAQSAGTRDRGAASARESTGSSADDADATPRRRDRRVDETAAAAETARARRHSSRVGEAFPSLVGWTSLSTLLPGIGLLRTRFRPLGFILLGGFVLTFVIALLYVLIKGPVRAFGTVVSSPSLLTFLAIALAVIGVIWILVIIVSHFGLRRGHRYASWQNKMAGVLVVSLALIIGIPFGVGSVYAQVQGDTVSSLFGDSTGHAQSAEDLWADKPYINVFLMGRDNGDDREGTRPDTMLVASIDTKTGNAALISVPRNLAFPIFPEGSELDKRWPDGFRPTGQSSVDLINSVWQWGEQNKDSIGDTHGLEPGMFATMQAVEGSLGLNLDYWASVDMAGFEDVVDAIGGVKIDVERPIPMGGGKSMSGVSNEVYGWVDPGPQTLKGKDALWYVRSREGSDNYDRMCRQQRMIKTTLDQIDPRELATAYPKLANSATKNIATSIPQNEVPAFIELALAMQKGEITTVQINNDVTPTYDPDFDKLHEWIEGEVKGASDGGETAKPTNDASAETSTDSAAAEEEPADEAAGEQPADEGGQESTEPTKPGEPNAQGKCYPKGYEPGDDFPGYPGPGAGDEE
ncbi:cell envelope-related function transcriptional attenuator common domain-containing protein [Brevibacterium sandarakinum]|uniref:Cell envelope-related function transcriptional attenuator common domain-containing protein n=1 Tax=Brevibacterium sandarakinum TaxID=629680 RepID=A0A1H1TUX8_BRESA|nr:LCP family protein [Brevibacterium sandarakinum]SDS63419.1 cell envelope-related function transcriptional attenuator common domain-containing protein [Brevibacterium sandarakinum]